jgi:hypothetical protein
MDEEIRNLLKENFEVSKKIFGNFRKSRKGKEDRFIFENNLLGSFNFNHFFSLLFCSALFCYFKTALRGFEKFAKF